MKRIYLFCGVGCVVALFAVTAFSQGYQKVPVSPCSEMTPACHTKATPCCENAPASKTCCQDTCCAVTVKATVAAPATKQANVYDLLEKLDALKAKQDALESEVRETRALLNEKFRTLQERVSKASMPPNGSPYAPAITYGFAEVPVTTAVPAPYVCVPAQPVGTPVAPTTCLPPERGPDPLIRTKKPDPAPTKTPVKQKTPSPDSLGDPSN
jgi:hypothetical protein